MKKGWEKQKKNREGSKVGGKEEKEKKKKGQGKKEEKKGNLFKSEFDTASFIWFYSSLGMICAGKCLTISSLREIMHIQYNAFYIYYYFYWYKMCGSKTLYSISNLKIYKQNR